MNVNPVDGSTRATRRWWLPAILPVALDVWLLATFVCWWFCGLASIYLRVTPASVMAGAMWMVPALATIAALGPWLIRRRFGAATGPRGVTTSSASTKSGHPNADRIKRFAIAVSLAGGWIITATFGRWWYRGDGPAVWMTPDFFNFDTTIDWRPPRDLPSTVVLGAVLIVAAVAATLWLLSWWQMDPTGVSNNVTTSVDSSPSDNTMADTKYVTYFASMGRPFDWLNRHRTRMAIGYLAILFPGVVLRNAVGAGGWIDALLTGVTIFCGLVVGIAVLMKLIERLANHESTSRTVRWGRAVRWLILIGVIGVINIAAWFGLMVVLGETTPWSSADSRRWMIASVCLGSMCGLGYLTASVASIWGRSSTQNSRRSWSIMTVPISITMLGTSTWFVTRHEPIYFASLLATLPADQWVLPFKTNVPLTTSAELRRLRTKTDGVAFATAFENNRNEYFIIELSDASEPDGLAPLRNTQLAFGGVITVANVRPGIDLSPLQTMSASIIYLHGGSIDVDQITSVMRSRYVYLVDIDKVESADAFNGAANVFIKGNNAPEGMTDLLRLLDSGGSNIVWLDCPLTVEDIGVISAFENVTYVHIASVNQLPNGAWSGPNRVPPGSLRGVSLGDLYDLNPDRATYLRMAEAGLPLVNEIVPDGVNVWDVIFALPESNHLNPYGYQNEVDLEDSLVHNHWIYHRDSKGCPVSAWLPKADLINQIGNDLQSVKVLRLDHRGVVGLDPSYEDRDAWSNLVLESLPNLRRLYLPEHWVISDDSFLRPVGELQHLQIAYDPGATVGPGSPAPGAGLVKCRQLRTLRLFDIPPPSVIAALTKLPKLESIEVVVYPNELSPEANDEAIAALKKSLVGIEVRRIELGDYEPELSDEFRAQRRRLRRELGLEPPAETDSANVR